MILTCADAQSTPLMATELQQHFRSSLYWPLRQLICELDHDGLTVRGTLPSFYLRQVAEAMAQKFAGTGRVHSDILVEHH